MQKDYEVWIFHTFNKCFIVGVGNTAAAKAEIVDALKSACLDLKVGEKIAALLDKSPIWSQYKDQRHDLFLPAPRTQAIMGMLHFLSTYLTDKTSVISQILCFFFSTLFIKFLSKHEILLCKTYCLSSAGNVIKNTPQFRICLRLFYWLNIPFLT